MSGSHLTRRTFLSLSAALAASAAAAPALRFAPRPATASILTPGVKPTPSFCEMCFWKCGIDAWSTRDGRLVQITGNADHPLSNGRLCPRGTGGLGAVYDPDRIREMVSKLDQQQGESPQAQLQQQSMALEMQQMQRPTLCFYIQVNSLQQLRIVKILVV